MTRPIGCGRSFSRKRRPRASYDVLAGWADKYGLPQSLYVDRDSIYRCEGLGSIAEQIADQNRKPSSVGRCGSWEWS